MKVSRYLRWPDYIIFVLLLLVSAIVGIFFGWRAKRATTGDYLLGGRNMSVLPVALSLLASFMSAITLLGTPSEIYVYGLQYIWIGFAYAIMLIFATEIYLPVFYKAEVSTSYQYLGKRFNSRSVQILGGVFFIVQMVIYMGIVIYAPSLAVSAVTGLNVWISVVCIAVIATFYTTIGGIKAVIWTDVIQTVIMFGGLLLILIRGTINIGGISAVWEANTRGKRTEMLNIDINPTTRHTVWGQVIGNTFMWISVYGVNQTMVQRALSVKSARKAKIAYWLNLPGLVLLMLIGSACGLVLYAAYEMCDPVLSNQIQKNDQLLPLFVMDYLSDIPCFAGVFISSIFSGALSTVSSGINSLASVTLHDILGFTKFFSSMTEYEKTRACKIIALIYGLTALAMSLLASQMGQVLQAAIGLHGILGGPMLGLFTLGMCFPFANWKGAIAGHLTGQGVVFWIASGYYLYNVQYPKLPTNTSECAFNFTTALGNETVYGKVMGNWESLALNTTSQEGHSNGQEDIFYLYKMSYAWYCMLGWLITVVVGVIVSAITKGENDVCNSEHLARPVRRCLRKAYGSTEYLEDREFMKFSSQRKSNEDVTVPLTSIQ